jgi:hypothetical protein
MLNTELKSLEFQQHEFCDAVKQPVFVLLTVPRVGPCTIVQLFDLFSQSLFNKRFSLKSVCFSVSQHRRHHKLKLFSVPMLKTRPGIVLSANCFCVHTVFRFSQSRSQDVHRSELFIFSVRVNRHGPFTGSL